ncbi:MAG: hypothetical protein HYV04_09780, partial [Deltaproteobacteria bacterium]|nr:hypothetical protein [Deltaproteobacteria bacterium]
MTAAIRAAGHTPTWAYLGDDVPRRVTIERDMTQAGIRSIEFGSLIRAAADELRSAYVDYIGRLSVRFDSAYWRYSSVAEKNPYVSRVFLHACCVRASKVALGRLDPGETLLLIVQERILRDTLQENLKSSGSTVCIIEPRWTKTRSVARSLFELVARQAYFFASNLTKIAIARYWLGLHRMKHLCSAIDRGVAVTITHAWVDQRACDPQTGEFHDSDFAEVARYLEAKGQVVFTLPYILRSAAYLRIVRFVARSGGRYLIPHAFLRPSDIMIAALAGLVAWPQRASFPPFAGMDLTAAIRADLWRDWYRQRQMESHLFVRVVYRWARAGLQIARYIYPFENHAWERAFCDAFRRSYPLARLIGHQPSGLPTFLMNYFIAREERDLVPLPNIIVTNGRHAARVLSESGYGASLIVCGGGLRQRYLQPWLDGQIPLPDRSTPQRGCILVTPSIGREGAVELIYKVVIAFSDVAGVRVLIKCHPGMPFERVAQRLSWLDLPSCVEISRMPIRELLPSADVLIYNDVTLSCAEAVAADVPVLYVEPDYGLALDTLDAYPELRQVARTPDGIRRIVLCLLEGRTQGVRGWDARSKVRELIGPVTNDTYELFLCG